VRFHAQGGLGEVYVADDEELRRQVALKRLPRSRAGHADSRCRFLREAEITGSLEHPGVVPVYGLMRSPDGQLSYAMRFIKGQTLEAAIRRLHDPETAAGDPGRPGLLLRQLLNRFVAVCNTMAYAHGQGVIHRDLKPANILVGEYGETLVIDWGLAKQLTPSGNDGQAEGPDTAGPAAGEDGTATASGEVLGTPAYMSPEQAAGRWHEVGPASDIYSLGATLYALLTNQAPFTGTNPRKVLRQVEAGGFPPPRQVNPATPRALEAVCLKAMAQRPAERYATALELAGDIERWLADEPVRAYREPGLVRLGRWGRRHRPLVAAAVALLVTAVAGLSAVLWAVERERRQTARERDDKEQARALAMKALRSLTDDVVEERLARSEQLTDEEKRFLRQVLAHYEELAALHGDGIESRAIRAEGLARVGLVRYHLGELKEAEAAYREALALRKQLAADFPGVANYRQELATSHNHLGILLQATGRLEEAEGAYRQALTLRKQLAADFPSRPDFRRDLARSHNGLGLLLGNTARAQEAEAAYHEALALHKQLTADFPTRPDFRWELATGHNNLGSLLVEMARLPEAEATHRQALTLCKQLAAELPGVANYRRELARSHANLGCLFAATGRPQQAEEALREALALRRQLAVELPAVPDYRNDLAGAMVNLAQVLRVRKKFEESRHLLEEAQPHHQAVLRANPHNPDYRRYWRNNLYLLALACACLGDQAAAIQAADGLCNLGWHASDDAYYAARTLAWCVSIVKWRDQLTEEKRQEQAKVYADRAMDLLRQAVATGYKDLPHMEKDKNLDALRGRDDFKKLVEQLETKGSRPGG
jgi:serine/threonine-protein kinase